MTQSEFRDLMDVLGRLDAWVAREVPLHDATLCPGVTDTTLDAFEAWYSVTLPETLRTLYHWNGGGDLFGLEFLCFSSLELARVNWADIAADPVTDLGGVLSHPPGAIRPLYATGDWLPFLHDGGGNYVALDLHPGPTGRPGQVITTGRDEAHRYVLAPDLDSFLREYLRRVESGRVTVRRRRGFDVETWEVRLQESDGHAPEGYGVLADLFPAFDAAPQHMATE